jgi:tuberculosinol/isotuberculosinol synthase
MNLETFQQLPREQVAALARQDGGKVCVFPINGTRRWFMLEHAAALQGNPQGDPIRAYMDAASENHIALYRLLFGHGLDTLVTPEFGSELFLRGDEYIRRIGADGLARLASDPMFMDFYIENQVRVRFYGDYRHHLLQTPYAYLVDLFDEASAKTASHDRHRLFIGVFGDDATRLISEFSVEYHRQHGWLPDKGELVSMYYGETVAPASLFIGFDKFSVFDYPLLASGEEDLYFTIAPSPYLSETQLRSILYDHLFTRREREVDYQSMPAEDLRWLKAFYAANRQVTLGTGIIKAGVWVPSSPISFPG